MVEQVTRYLTKQGKLYDSLEAAEDSERLENLVQLLEDVGESEGEISCEQIARYLPDNFEFVPKTPA